MGVLRGTDDFKEELEEFEMFLLQRQQQGIVNHSSRKNNLQYSLLSGILFKGRSLKSMKAATNINNEGTVCVTSAISFLGFALVNSLLSHGYTVRLLLDTPEDLEKAREMQIFGSGPSTNDDGNSSVVKVEMIVVTDMMDVNMLIQAFQNCTCVFHTSAFTDPNGVSGYSKHMADIEAKIAERVIKACVSSGSVRKCVFTSSLLSCIWRSPQNHSHLPMIVDENCWSDESLCRDKKLWYALGKTMAEKAAWKAAHGSHIKLVTLCPGLVTGPGFPRRNSTASIAYLKGAKDMVTQGLLATVDVGKLAGMHISVCEEMGRTTACGRYICFDHIIRQAQDVDELAQRLGIPTRISMNDTESNESPVTWFELSKRKLSRLMSSSRSCSYGQF